MGSNRRYAEQVDRRMDTRIGERVMRSGPPQSLTNAELELDVQPLTRPPRPELVRAWVRFPAAPLLVEARAVGWTSRAVSLEWDGPDGLMRAWVWAGAVDGRL